MIYRINENHTYFFEQFSLQFQISDLSVIQTLYILIEQLKWFKGIALFEIDLSYLFFDYNLLQNEGRIFL